jgi:tRNA 2-thiouridine synthesizing protein A
MGKGTPGIGLINVCIASMSYLCGKIKAIYTSFESMVMEFHKELDARGLHCPLPILKAKKALAEMESAQVLRVITTDPGSVRDFQAFAKQTGNELLSQEESNKEFVFFMRRK